MKENGYKIAYYALKPEMENDWQYKLKYLKLFLRSALKMEQCFFTGFSEEEVIIVE